MIDRNNRRWVQQVLDKPGNLGDAEPLRFDDGRSGVEAQLILLSIPQELCGNLQLLTSRNLRRSQDREMCIGKGAFS